MARVRLTLWICAGLGGGGRALGGGAKATDITMMDNRSRRLWPSQDRLRHLTSTAICYDDDGSFCQVFAVITMLRTVFSFRLSNQIISGKVAIGKFDGITPCLVAATVAEKVIWHNRKGANAQEDSLQSEQADVCVLNINQTVQSLTTGCLKSDSSIEYLVVGTPCSILVYDVEKNMDLFYRDIADGANAVVVGYIGSSVLPVAIAGGNCAIQGYTGDGEDAYWTVTGDNITSLALFDLTDDGQNELVAGSEDYDIRVFKDEAILYEISETDVITSLCGIYPQTFGYALKNGTVGVYHKQERIWRIKSKNRAAALTSWDINGDGVPELVTGWTSGKLDARSIETGEVVFKDSFADAIAAIFICDYNMDGIEEIVVVSVEGEVRGYQRIGREVRTEESSQNRKREEDMVRELMRKKQELLLELSHFEASDWNTRIPAGNIITDPLSEAGIPADTQIRSTLVLAPDETPASIHLSLSTSNDTVIRAAVVFAEGIFKGESFVVHAGDQDVGSSVRMTLRPEKDAAIDLHVKAVVGTTDMDTFHVFELTRRLPKFSMYAFVPNGVKSAGPTGRVTFPLNERPQKLHQWCQKSFLVQCEALESDSFSMTLLCLRDCSLLRMSLTTVSNEFTVETDDITLAGEIIQSLVADFLAFTELRSQAHFPREVDQLKGLVSRVEEIQSVRQQLGADIAENSVKVRNLVIQSEDARLLQEYKQVRQCYMDINSVNRDLVSCQRIREKNHEDLVAALKQINLLIQKTANLRVGKPKADMIQACRQAIRQNNLNVLTKIVTSGDF